MGDLGEEEEEERGLDGWTIFGDQSVGVVGDVVALMGDFGLMYVDIGACFNGSVSFISHLACLDHQGESISRFGTGLSSVCMFMMMHVSNHVTAWPGEVISCSISQFLFYKQEKGREIYLIAVSMLFYCLLEDSSRLT